MVAGGYLIGYLCKSLILFYDTSDTCVLAPILPGERRTLSNGMIARALYQRAGRVYWKLDNGRSAWTGTQSWRKFPIAD